jgi:hypothetical protein
LLHPEHVLDEAVTFHEVLSNRPSEPAVKIFAGSQLLGERVSGSRRGGISKRRCVYDHPEPQETAQGLRENLNVALLLLAPLPIAVDGLDESLYRPGCRRAVAPAIEILIDGVLDDGTLRTA